MLSGSSVFPPSEYVSSFNFVIRISVSLLPVLDEVLEDHKLSAEIDKKEDLDCTGLLINSFLSSHVEAAAFSED
ncbi:hypothetical protein RHMOL_Rhmol11G0259300 [Rhododendron molle]|uniref:Uncharacterized protein n=1 Tax=Rhododendron molle TaxID=49168 RepID=A0ACC0LX81_RHOML|nr:hypothetical protein RHMOL_Rhmol11G0259300 [Rhododendron molle]